MREASRRAGAGGARQRVIAHCAHELSLLLPACLLLLLQPIHYALHAEVMPCGEFMPDPTEVHPPPLLVVRFTTLQPSQAE